MSRIGLSFLTLALLSASAQAQEAPTLKLMLEDSLRSATQFSPRLQSAQQERTAAEKRALVPRSLLLPRLSLEGSYRYVTVIPNLNLMPGQSIPFGDNHGYSVGAVVNWSIWDSGGIWQSWTSLQHLERAKTAEETLVERQVLTATRMAYFSAMQAAERSRLIAESLKLVQVQYRDIHGRYQVGAASRADALSSHREVLKYESQYRQAQTDFSVALHELLSLIGQMDEKDLSSPVDKRMEGRLPADVPKPTIVVELESTSSATKNFAESRLSTPPSARHPQVQILSQTAEAHDSAAGSAASGHWPKIQAFAKTSLDYPNGPNIEQIHQNSVGVVMSWSIFEFGRVRHEVAEKHALAQSSAHRANQALVDLHRDWRKAKEQIASLRAQQDFDRASTAEAEELAKVIYASYRAGRAGYLDVEAANLRVLDAKMQSARNEIQTLMQLATLASVSDQE